MISKTKIKRLYKIYKSPIRKLHRILNRTQFLIFLGALVGITAGFAAVLLKTIVHYIRIFLSTDYNIPFQYYVLAILPFVGILLTVFVVKHFFNGNIGRGISNVLFEIAQKSSFVQHHKMYSHIITSSLTVGFGGSAGLEAPIVVTGSAIGSNFGKAYNVNYKDRTLLLACGAAAGIAAVFNAPVAGIMFAMEVMLTDITIIEMLPLIIAAVSGALCSKIVLQEEILFFFNLKQSFNYANVPFYIGLGILSGFVSLYYARMTHRIEHFFSRYKNKIYLRAIIGGTILIILTLLFPPLFGEGYNSIKILSDGNPSALLDKSIFASFSDTQWFVLIFVGLIAFVKVIATSITLSSGGNGGNFAPSLFVGAFFGYFYAHFINLFRTTPLPESNFTLVSMSGVLSGVMYAPLTGIFLIAEITGGYDLMIPLMIVSSFSFFIAKHFEPYSMDTKKLATIGQIFTSDKDNNILTLIKTADLIEQDIMTIQLDSDLGDLVEILKNCHRYIFAVVNAKNEFEGILSIDDIRSIMFRQDLYNKIRIREILKIPPVIIQTTDDMRTVMKKFDESGHWNIPVLDKKIYVGFISKSRLLLNYRNQLRKQTGIL